MTKAIESEPLNGFCLQSETTAAFAVVFFFYTDFRCCSKNRASPSKMTTIPIPC